MSILASAGRAKIYNTDGTGRDTYVSFNSGGFAAMKSPAAAQKSGAFAQSQLRASAQHIARGGGQGSPGKVVHYPVNGTGRDSYIHANHGGFCGNYGFQNDRDAYVRSLRGYPNPSSVTAARSLNTRSPRAGSPRDHFAEGQASIRSPRAQRGMHELKTYQKHQVDRLAQPKRGSLTISFDDLEQLNRSSVNLQEKVGGGLRADSPRSSSNFLRKTVQGAAFNMNRSPSLDGAYSPKVGASLQEHLSMQIKPAANNDASPTGHNLTARSLRNMLVNKDGEKQITSARQSQRQSEPPTPDMSSSTANQNNRLLQAKKSAVVHQNLGNKMNKRRMLTLGDPMELEGIRITNGNTYDRYERPKNIGKQ